MFDAARARIEQIRTAPQRALPRAAARIHQKLREDATLHTGKVPSGIMATATAEGVEVTGPDWVMRIADQKGEPAQWADIVREELRAEIGGG